MSKRGGDDYEVGYANPPRYSRWPKGKSGNPSGRPKHSKAMERQFKEALAEKVTITTGNRTRKVTKLQASFMQLATKAAGGDVRAIREVVALGDKFGFSKEEWRQAMPPSLHVHFVSPEMKEAAKESDSELQDA